MMIDNLEAMSTVAELKQFLQNRGRYASEVLWAPGTGRADPDFTPLGDWVIQLGSRGGYRLCVYDRNNVVGDTFRCRSERDVVQTILRNDAMEPPPGYPRLPALGVQAPDEA